MEFLSMGGYGAYVWASYTLTFGVVILCVAMGKRRQRRVLEYLRIRLRATPEKGE